MSVLFLQIPPLILRMFADIVFPPVCLSCNAPLSGPASYTCPSCRAAILPVDEWDEPYRDALRRLNQEGTVAEFVAAWYYERGGPMQALVHRLKYDRVTSLGGHFGRVLGERVREAGLGGADLVLPLPLHLSKERERGFNQSEEIARGVAWVTGRPLAKGLIRRSTFTPSQTPLSPGERRENVRGAFAVRKPASREIPGKTILLVDDVVTTGATMRACAGALRTAGARAVIACAVALAR